MEPVSGPGDGNNVGHRKDGSDQLVLTAADGRDIIIKDDFTYDETGDNTSAEDLKTVFSTLQATGGVDAAASSNTQTWGGSLSFSSTTDITLIGQAKLCLSTPGISVDLSDNISTVDVSTVSNANSAIETVDAALTAIDSSRASLGAVQNRFESTIANLQSISENISAARSRIVDADFAAETANLTKAQIMQQAGVAMLAQANTLPQAVLGLLQ